MFGLCAAGAAATGAAQPTAVRQAWSLEQVVAIACQSSPDAQAARHTFRSAYWDYRSYRADYLPSLTLTSNPNLNRSINEVTMEDGTVRFVEQNLLGTDLSLSLQQNISWTGGVLSLESSLQRVDLLSDRSFSWKSVYEEARRAYLETMSLVAANATDKFFSLVTAESNYRTACQNYAQADTLCRFAQGRYQIGTITENEMLQLEIVPDVQCDVGRDPGGRYVAPQMEVNRNLHAAEQHRLGPYAHAGGEFGAETPSADRVRSDITIVHHQRRQSGLYHHEESFGIVEAGPLPGLCNGGARQPRRQHQ